MNRKSIFDETRELFKCVWKQPSKCVLKHNYPKRMKESDLLKLLAADTSIYERMTQPRIFD